MQNMGLFTPVNIGPVWLQAATTVRFRLNIPREEAMRYYNGTVRFVIVHADNGQRIQFPAKHIRPFIDQLRVNGYFSLQFDDSNKLLGLNRVT